SDRAIHPAFAEEFGQVCKLLHEHCQRARDQQLILVGGDVHLGAISELRWDSGAKAVQLISSGITRKPERGVTLLSSLAVRAHHATEPTTDHEPHADLVASDAEHPFLGCNLALIELEMQQDGRWSTDLSIHGVTEQRFGCIVQHAVSAP
ncbi:MAG: hypothetical protein AB8H80_18545, partial [Planctomycetota bacterium]